MFFLSFLPIGSGYPPQLQKGLGFDPIPPTKRLLLALLKQKLTPLSSPLSLSLPPPLLVFSKMEHTAMFPLAARIQVALS